MSSDEIDLNIVFTTKKFQIESEKFDNEKWKFVGPSISERNDKCTIPLDSFNNKIIYITWNFI